MAEDEQDSIPLLGQWKADVLRLAQSEPYAEAGHVVMLGLLDIVEGLMRRSVRVDPEPLPILLSRIDAMRANVRRAASERSPAVGPTRQH